MPIHSVPGGGKQWGHQKAYHGKGAEAKAKKQQAAIYANGYRGDASPPVMRRMGPEQEREDCETTYIDLYTRKPVKP